ncbi:MAG: phosphate ABC transporter ATP-binding protein, partial [Bacteroidales bacterium]|nr:phosphate ABC transporter ATP-binding protein [Bacteroidales bacterium]
MENLTKTPILSLKELSVSYTPGKYAVNKVSANIY